MKERSPRFLRRTLLTGLGILLPLFITYVLLAFLFNLFTSVSAPLAKAVASVAGLDRYAWITPLESVVNLLLSITVIFVLGLIGTNILGRQVLAAFDSLLLRLPLVKSIYGAAKQMVDTFRGPDRSFQRVVLLQYPSQDLWSLGFVVAERQDTLHLASSDTMLAVFIPTTPNPTSGFLVLVSPEKVLSIDYSVEEAFKFIISLGIVGKDLTPGSATSVLNTETRKRPG
jgi:uncharacterized membrane protein